MNQKLLPALGAALWILGLILSIVGLNIHSNAGTWMSVIGNIIFLVGLGLEGIWYFRRKREEPEGRDESADGKRSDPADAPADDKAARP